MTSVFKNAELFQVNMKYTPTTQILSDLAKNTYMFLLCIPGLTVNAKVEKYYRVSTDIYTHSQMEKML